MTPQLLALIAVCILGIVIFLPLVAVSLDIAGERSFQRRMKLAQSQIEIGRWQSYQLLVQNCTAQGRPAPLPGAFGKARR